MKILLALLLLPGLASAKAPSDPCDRTQAELDAVDAILLEAWKSDKEDRDTGNPQTSANDAKRLKIAAKLHDKGHICSALNAYHAAWVLQRGNDPVLRLHAHEYAKQAMEAHIQNGAWLTAVTYDLLQLAYGRPQRFGSQMFTEAGRMCLFPVDASATDEERKQYQIRPIAETYRVVLDANGAGQAPATKASLDNGSLWCALTPLAGALPE